MANNYYVTDKYYGDTAPKEKSDSVFGIRTIGSARWLEGNNSDPIKAIQGDIWAGAGHIEITAPGTGRGGRGNSTFEEIDTEQRQAIRELVKINDVNLSVHATPQVTLTGLGNEGFSEQQRQRAIYEIQKAIDFSRDASSGGSVVVHTGEFPRPLDTKGWYENEFQFHPGEKEDARFLLVDKETGQLVQSVKANEVVVLPEYDYDEEKKEYKYLRDEKGDFVFDDVLKEYMLHKHNTTDWNKVPDYDQKEARIRLTKTDDHGNIKTKQQSFQEFVADKEKEGLKRNEILVEFYKQQAYGSVQQALGQSRHYESSYREGLEARDAAAKKLKFYKEMREKLKDSPEEWEQMKASFSRQLSNSRGLDQVDRITDPVEFYEERVGDTQRQILYGQETALGGRKQAKELLRRIDKVQDVQEFALNKSKDSFAKLGIYAMEQTMAAQKMRPNDNVKPIFVTLENIYPEHGYGSHPEELMELVKNARGEMAKELMEKMNYDKKRAEKAAEDHLKITFDTGHMNMWRKHYIPKPGESKEETDKRFNEWYLKQVDKLVDSNMIGNVHLADNFGYEDAHLAPGAGSAPIKGVLERLEKKGYDKKMVVEGGFNQGKNGFHETWKMVGAHVDSKYAKGRNGTDAWLNPNSNFKYLRDGYLGIAQRPNFIFKGYSPDSDDWKPWSGLGME